MERPARQAGQATGGDHHKIRARETVVDDALRGLVEPLPVARDATVLVHDDHFHPATLTIARRATVTWRWTGAHQHDLRFRHRRGQPRVAGARARLDGEIRRRFTRAGTYRYLCTLQGGMTGTIRVR
jgi:plastocyanin